MVRPALRPAVSEGSGLPPAGGSIVRMSAPSPTFQEKIDPVPSPAMTTEPSAEQSTA